MFNNFTQWTDSLSHPSIYFSTTQTSHWGKKKKKNQPKNTANSVCVCEQRRGKDALVQQNLQRFIQTPLRAQGFLWESRGGRARRNVMMGIEPPWSSRRSRTEEGGHDQRQETASRDNQSLMAAPLHSGTVLLTVQRRTTRTRVTALRRWSWPQRYWDQTRNCCLRIQ